MARNKYIQDYRLVEHIDARGRIRTEHEYIGPYYCYVHAASVKREKRLALGLCAGCAVLFIAALLPDSSLMRRWFVSLPFLFAAIPLVLLIDMFLILPAPDKLLERRQADKLSNRYPAAAAFLIGLSALALLGSLGCLIFAGGANGADVLVCVCAAAILACGVVLFRRRHYFETEKA